MEAALLDLLSSTDERHSDGAGVAERKANDTNAGESVVGRCGTKVNEAESELHSHTQHHSVDRDIQFDVDLFP